MSVSNLTAVLKCWLARLPFSLYLCSLTLPLATSNFSITVTFWRTFFDIRVISFPQISFATPLLLVLPEIYYPIVFYVRTLWQCCSQASVLPNSHLFWLTPQIGNGVLRSQKKSFWSSWARPFFFYLFEGQTGKTYGNVVVILLLPRCRR